jgi:hypothetical protein
MLEAAQTHPDILDDPRPTVELKSFGENGIELELLVWTREPRRQNTLRSDLNFRIFEAFGRHQVTIPYPQQDVHLHAPWLEAVVGALARRYLTPEELATVTPLVSTAVAPLADDATAEEPRPAEWEASQIAALVERMRAPDGVAIADRRHLLTTYRRCFVGRDAVDWLVAREALSRDEALAVGRLLVQRGQVRHVLDEHGFEDGVFFYRFVQDQLEGGGVTLPDRSV